MRPEKKHQIAPVSNVKSPNSQLSDGKGKNASPYFIANPKEERLSNLISRNLISTSHLMMKPAKEVGKKTKDEDYDADLEKTIKISLLERNSKYKEEDEKYVEEETLIEAIGESKYLNDLGKSNKVSLDVLNFNEEDNIDTITTKYENFYTSKNDVKSVERTYDLFALEKEDNDEALDTLLFENNEVANLVHASEDKSVERNRGSILSISKLDQKEPKFEEFIDDDELLLNTREDVPYLDSFLYAIIDQAKSEGLEAIGEDELIDRPSEMLSVNKKEIKSILYKFQSRGLLTKNPHARTWFVGVVYPDGLSQLLMDSQQLKRETAELIEYNIKVFRPCLVHDKHLCNECFAILDEVLILDKRLELFCSYLKIDRLSAKVFFYILRFSISRTAISKARLEKSIRHHFITSRAFFDRCKNYAKFIKIISTDRTLQDFIFMIVYIKTKRGPSYLDEYVYQEKYEATFLRENLDAIQDFILIVDALRDANSQIIEE
jgi:hypothetical protein